MRFSCFNDVYPIYDKQQALNRLRADQIYEQARKDNPTMIEPSRVVDFSDPEAVRMMQPQQMHPHVQIGNPYGYNNPYMNPNAVQANPNINPAFMNAPAYGQPVISPPPPPPTGGPVFTPASQIPQYQMDEINRQNKPGFIPNVVSGDQIPKQFMNPSPYNPPVNPMYNQLHYPQPQVGGMQLNPNIYQPGFNTYPRPLTNPISNIGGTWYNGFGYNGYGYGQDNFMLPDENDDPRYCVRGVHIATDEEEEKLNKKFEKLKTESKPKKYYDYLDRVRGKNLVVLGISYGDEDEKPSRTVVYTIPNRKQTIFDNEFLDDDRFEIKKAKRFKHEPNKPFTKEELDPDYNQVRVLKDTPMIWSNEDRDYMRKLIVVVKDFDKALAEVLTEFEHGDRFKNMSREDYNYFRMFINNYIFELRVNKQKNPHLDYEADYRHIKLPLTMYNEETKRDEVTSELLDPAEKVFNKTTGKYEYDYDRGRDLTADEWRLFKDRAFMLIIKGAKELRAEDIFFSNESLAKDKMEQSRFKPIPNPKDEEYNPYDPVQSRMHQMKMKDYDYQVNKQFWRYVLRNQMTDRQFNNWWYGTEDPRGLNRPNQDEVNRINRQNYVTRMNRERMLYLSQLRPIDNERLVRYWNDCAQKALRKFDEGTVHRDMSAKEFMDNLGFLMTRISEDNIERQNQERMQNAYMVHGRTRWQPSDFYRRSWYETSNRASFPNPNDRTQYGTVDPRFGLPTNYVDLGSSDDVQSKVKKAMDYTQRMYGKKQPMLRPVYK